MKFVGRKGDEVLFVIDNTAVFINEKQNVVSNIDTASTVLASFVPEGHQDKPDSIPYELALSATTDLDIKVFSNNDRMYTIPDAVKAEAQRAIEWRKEHDRGGTPVGMNTARTLAKGGQIGIKKIRHIAKYFPRHEVDKKGTGYKPGQKNYPSNGRIAWALWGGDAAERWASAIVERENKKAQANSVTASYRYIMSEQNDPTAVELNAFELAYALPQELAPEFFIRIRLDGSGVDRLYKAEPTGEVSVWDDGMWEDLGHLNHDFLTYDKSLDDISDVVEKIHVPVDVESAIAISGMFDVDPYKYVGVTQVNPEESGLVSEAVDDIDWEEIYRLSMGDDPEYEEAMFAVGAPVAAPAQGDAPTGDIQKGDGKYTPAERSQNASGQVRNKLGMFAKAGSQVVIGGKSKYTGKIVGMNADTQTVKVELENGITVDVPGNLTQESEGFVEAPETSAPTPEQAKALTRNILGETKPPADKAGARLSERMSSMTPQQTGTVVADYPNFVGGERAASLKVGTQAPATPPAPLTAKNAYQTPNAYNSPLLRAFLEKKVVSPTGEVTYPNAIWYRPDLAGIDPSEVESYKDKLPSAEKFVKDRVNTPLMNSPAMQQPAKGFSKPTASTPAAPAPSAPKKLANGVVQTGTKTEPIYTKDYNGFPVQTNKDGDPIKGAYVEIPDQGVKYAGTLVKRGEASGGLAHTGEIGTAKEKYEKNYDGVREYKSADGTIFYGKRGVVVPAGKMMTSNGTIVDRPKTASAIIASAENVELTPDTSDVPPVYMAVVAPDDAQAVMDLIALVPKSSQSEVPTTFKRKNAQWIKDEGILNDLNSPTPPPVIVLDNNTLADVLGQIDGPEAATASAIVETMMAAGGLDKNRGNAENLREYWLRGKGAAKIRWNTPGDWTRCVRQLSKYMGPRAKGYCALRHKEATGMWTGDKEHRQIDKVTASGKRFYSDDFIISSSSVLASAEWRAQQIESAPTGEKGAPFFIPLVIPEDVESGDGRKFDKGVITMRELPLPLMWQIATGEGHSGSVVVGKITEMERTENGIGNARGWFDTGEHGKEAERLVRGGFIRGVSADMDNFEADEETNASETDSDKKVGAGKMKITKARVMAVTIVPKPAFQECTIKIAEAKAPEQEEKAMLSDGVYVEGVNPLDASALVACGLVAGMIPVTPPKEWFDNPKLTKPTALTVTDDGKVYGHIAAWHVDHIGMAFGTKPPRSRSSYAYFHTGVVKTEEGADVPVGQLTLAGGHASLEASASEAVRHYDDTASAIADVHAGEDAYGIYVSGALRPGTTPEQIRSLRASAPSGDWRPIKGGLELVAVCQVNVPGFPIARARVASGQVMALVAAGASVLAQLKHDPLADIQARLDRVESVTTEPLVAAANDAKARMESMTAAVKAGELSKRFKSIKDSDSFYMTQMLDDDTTELAIIPRRERIKLAGEGKALKDGSFPIRNESDLRNAIHAFGRAKPGKRGLVRRHIVKMARALDRKDIIPEAWKEASDTTVTASLRERIAIVEAVLASGDVKELPFVEGGQAPVSADSADACPPATGDISINLANRQKAIDNGGYGPLNPQEPNDEFWQEKATRWSVDIQEAKKSVCGNCVMFIRTPKMLDCISAGLEAGDSSKNNAWDAIDTAELGYCEAFDFKCASSRTCDAWVVGGPITAAAETEAPTQPATPAPVGVEKPVVEITDKDIKDLSDEELKALKQELKAKRQVERKVGGKYVPGKTQPRDTSGKFRTVLARLKADLGPNGSAEALAKIERVEQLGDTGDYLASAKAAGELLGMVDRLDTGALNAQSLENVRITAGMLGKTIANLPFAFGKDAQKIRFSDVPPVLQDLMRDMISRVEDKIGDKDAAEATQGLKTFMSGGDYFNQGEISSQMSKLLRLLT
jgi:hypothetical protein